MRHSPGFDRARGRTPSRFSARDGRVLGLLALLAMPACAPRGGHVTPTPITAQVGAAAAHAPGEPRLLAEWRPPDPAEAFAPTVMGVDATGRLLVAEKTGVVRVVVNGVLQADAFLDLRDRVNDYWDRGLLGVTIDPAFADNGYVYLFYVHEDDPLTYTGPKTSRVVRVTAVGNSADIETEVVLLDGLPADSPSHDGGAMQFGPDGRLWITTGDASSFNAVDPQALRAQQIDSLAGKLLRVDRDGRGLADNPFWNGDASAARSKVWAYGFRNPFRLTFRPSTGRPYIADVGANDWEEINAVARGGNHGWPCLEGPGPQAGYQSLAACQALYAGGPTGVVMPLVSYPHRAGTASISGGAFLTSPALPESWRGTYAFGDFARGTLHHVTIDAAGCQTPRT